MKSYVLACSHIWPCRNTAKVNQGHHLKNRCSTQVPNITYQISRLLDNCFKSIYHIWVWWPYRLYDLAGLNVFLFPVLLGTLYEIWLLLAFVEMFEIVILWEIESLSQRSKNDFGLLYSQTFMYLLSQLLLPSLGQILQNYPQNLMCKKLPILEIAVKRSR